MCSSWLGCFTQQRVLRATHLLACSALHPLLWRLSTCHTEVPQFAYPSVPRQEFGLFLPFKYDESAYKCAWTHCFVPPGETPQCGVAGSCDDSMLNCLRNCPSVFQNSHAPHSHRQRVGAPNDCSSSQGVHTFHSTPPVPGLPILSGGE